MYRLIFCNPGRMAHSVPLSRSSRQPGLVEFNRWATIGALPAKCRQITDMKTATRWIFVLAVSVWSTAYSAGHIEWFGYPVKDSVYKFEVYTGETDRWDSAAQDTPPLSPGKASLAAKKFVRTVPLRDDTKEWGLRSITLRQMSSAPKPGAPPVRAAGVPRGRYQAPHSDRCAAAAVCVLKPRSISGALRGQVPAEGVRRDRSSAPGEGLPHRTILNLNEPGLPILQLIRRGARPLLVYFAPLSISVLCTNDRKRVG